MGQFSKQSSIYLGLLLTCSTYTLISPFYPKVAEDKGLPIWLIGVMFALHPFANLLVTPFLGKYMNRIGRKIIVIASFVLTAASMIVLSPIELSNQSTVIFLSIFSRVLGGAGASCLFTSIITIFMSDYPDNIQVMIGRMEAANGLGMIMGPIFGTALVLINLFAALLIVGIAMLIFTPVAWFMLGTFRPYEVKEVSINKTKLLFRPKIFFTLLMSFAFLFSFAFISTILEIHLANFGMPQLFISLCFVLQSTTYLLVSLSSAVLLKGYRENTVMFIGVLFLGVSYMAMGPFTMIFPNEVWMVVVSLPIASVGQSLTYVFSVPYMINCAVEEYGYTNDDILTDVISTFTIISWSIGEIVGPLYVGFVSEIVGIEQCCNLAAVGSFAFGLVYALATGVFKCKKKVQHKDSLLINTKVVPEEN